MKTLIILPTYNEKNNLSVLVPKIFDVLPNTDLLFIDDHSPDGTAHVIKELQRAHHQIFLIERPQKMGLGSAYVAGFKWGLARNYNFFFQMDSDLSHHPQYLRTLMETGQQADLVLGSRYVKGGGIVGWNFFRHLLSKGGSLYAQLVLGLPFKDLMTGFKYIRGDALRKIDLDQIRSEGFCFQVEVDYAFYRSHLVIKEVPIIFMERRMGKSKLDHKIVIEALWKIPLLRWKTSATTTPSPSSR